jgi:hypothetical protein
MSNKVSDHPLVVALGIAAAIAGLLWFFTGRDFPRMLDHNASPANAGESLTSITTTDTSLSAAPNPTSIGAGPSATLAESSSHPGSATNGATLTKTDAPISEVSSEQSPSSTNTPSDASVDSLTESKGNTTNDGADKTKDRTTRKSNCSDASTGNYSFINTRADITYKVTVYYKLGSDENRELIIPPGQTGHLYDFPAGTHNYLVTYRALVPIMTFPPGAPTMPQDVIYLKGEIYLDECKSGLFEIK